MSKEDVRQLAALEAAIAVEDKAIAKLQRDMAGLNAEAEAVAAALEGVGGAELQEQRALAETLQQVGPGFKAHSGDFVKSASRAVVDVIWQRWTYTLMHTCVLLQSCAHSGMGSRCNRFAECVWALNPMSASAGCRTSLRRRRR